MKFVDTHIHCVQNTDDGSQSLSDSIQMLKMEYEQSVRDVFCTVHSEMITDMNDDAFALSQMENLIDAFQNETGNSMKLNLLTEIHINLDSFEDCFIGMKKIVPWFRPIDGAYYMFAFDYEETAENMVEICKRLIERGIKPVISHAERYTYILEAIDRLREIGCIIQVNIGSFVRGGFLAFTDIALQMLDNKQIDILGTDAHRMKWRPPVIMDGYNIIKDLTTEEYLYDICYGNAAKIFRLM